MRRVTVWGSLCLLFLMWMITTGVQADPQLMGQCYAFCVTRFVDQPKTRQLDTQGDVFRKRGRHEDKPGLIQICRRKKQCKFCLFACDRPSVNYTSLQLCIQDCKHPYFSRDQAIEECQVGCQFLSNAASAKVGKCPAKSAMSGFATACVENCHRDRDCLGSKKCCDNGCGFTCQKPVLSQMLPKKPQHVQFSTRKDGNVLVQWKSMPGLDDGLIVEPVFYIVRWWRTFSHSVNSKITDRPLLKIRHIPPSSSISVIVASVNVHGSRGFTRVKTYIKQITKPSEPNNFDETGFKVHDSTVDVTIEWQPPSRTDGLPVARYQVFWSDGLPAASPSYQRLNMYRKSVSPDQNHFILRNLTLGTRYFVQVLATIRWRGKIHRGRRASMYILTYRPPKSAEELGQVHRGGKPKVESPVYDVQVDETFYHDGTLKASISWKTIHGTPIEKFLIYWNVVKCPRKFKELMMSHFAKTHDATTHKRKFDLFNLHYKCEYEVQIHPVDKTGAMLPSTMTHVKTPACRHISVKGIIKPDCRQQVFQPPGRPPEIGIDVSVDGCVINVLVSWEQPSSYWPVTGYLVLWGETEANGDLASHIVYNNSQHKTFISGNTTTLLLQGLDERRHHTAQIWARSRIGDGPRTVKHFTTPKLTHCLRQALDSGTPTSREVSSNPAVFSTTQSVPQPTQKTTSIETPPSSGNRVSITGCLLVGVVLCYLYL
ncbi:anosmin-1-like [Gigantopelta aegis]|uniref:anosmin-1-like n=1 Tax=Gigantopelta aegis TaxID=1735272 RepID=UPI001B88B3D4|nr:anosmin-1-like [Gigantopelta aegis]